MDEDVWTAIIEGVFGGENILEHQDLGYVSDKPDFEFWSYKILDLSGDERDFSYVKNSATNKIGILGYSEIYNPDLIASFYPDEDPDDIKAISELLRGYDLHSVDILTINNQTPERYVELDCIKIVDGVLKYYEIQVIRKSSRTFCLSFSNAEFLAQDEFWDGGEGDIDLSEYQFTGNDYSLKDFPSHGYADGGEGDIDLSEYQFTDNSYADFRGTNG